LLKYLQMKQKIVLTLLIILTLWNVACNRDKKTDPTWTLENIPSPTPSPKEIADTMKENSLNVFARQLSADYIANEIKADNTYKGRTVVVTGTIQEITRGITGNIYVVLTGSNRMRTVFCYFDDEEKAARLKKGQEVSFKGICEGLLMSVIVNNCQLIEN
jgi:hypothetical protein